ncbi:hypothetical protein M1437_03895 [Patescibacteria group bacterium]|nr:hypothetical protein [Patescibacteria group bacterium]
MAGEIGETNEGRSAIPILVRAAYQVFDLITERYTTRRPQAEAQNDALLYAMVEYSNVRFDARQPFGPEETKKRTDRWENAISNAVLGNWEPMRNAIRNDATEAWCASHFDHASNPEAGPGEVLQQAAALQRLSQSL